MIKINSLKAQLALSNGNKEFEFDFNFDLCGKNHTPSFNMSIQGDLKEMVTSRIKELMDLKESLLASGEEYLDKIYGQLSNEDITGIKVANLSVQKENYRSQQAKSEPYNIILKDDNFHQSIHALLSEFNTPSANENGKLT